MAPSVIVLDASVVIALFNEHDRHHASATELLIAHAESQLIMHSLTLAKVLVAPARARKADAALFRLGRLGVQEWQDRVGQAHHVAALRVETGLRMPDVCVLNAALHHHASLATFDAGLVRACQALGVPVLPAREPE